MWVPVLTILLSTAWAAKLGQQVYLPPGAETAGGYPGDLTAPAAPGATAPGAFTPGAPAPGAFTPVAFTPGAPGPVPLPSDLQPQAQTIVPIIAYENQPNQGDGSYSYSYESGNGIKGSEEGSVKPGPEPDGSIQTVRGVYSYTGPDGVVYTIAYTADENGFVAHGDHLPTPPPIPPEILQSLEQNAAEEAATATPGVGGGGYSPTTPSPPATAAPAQVGYFKYNPPVNYYRTSNRYYRRY